MLLRCDAPHHAVAGRRKEDHGASDGLAPAKVGSELDKLVRKSKANTYTFRDGGLIPNNPRWPVIIYRRAVRFPRDLDPAAVIEDRCEQPYLSPWPVSCSVKEILRRTKIKSLVTYTKVDRAIEMLLAQILEIVHALLERGIVDQHIEAAEVLHRKFDRLLAICRIGNVAGDEDAGTAFLLHGALGRFGVLMLIEVTDGDVGTLTGEQHRDGAADAGIRRR